MLVHQSSVPALLTRYLCDIVVQFTKQVCHFGLPSEVYNCSQDKINYTKRKEPKYPRK